MQISRKRKLSGDHISIHQRSSTSAVDLLEQASKNHAALGPFNQGAKKRKVRDRSPVLAASGHAFKKQKSQDEESKVEPESVVASTEVSAVGLSKRNAVKRQREEERATPQNKRFKNMLPPSPAQTPTSKARNLFDKLDLAASKTTSTQSKYMRIGHTPPLTPESLEDFADIALEDLPLPLKDFNKLFSSFLNATSLYFAHNGTGSPLYLSTLLPLITKTWKRRRVTEQDLRRLLGVMGKAESSFTLTDNGEGGIRLERAEGVANASHINQLGLTARFERRLCDLWTQWTANGELKMSNEIAFLESLPLAGMTVSEVAADPIKLSQSKERLNRFKRDVVQTRTEEAAAKKPAVPTEAKTNAAVLSRGSSLLDRIQAKQQLLASRPDGPTQQELDRKAALDRIEDVARVMDLLAGARPRVSFSSQTMVQHLQGSLRNPISKDEAERCMDLMASEIAPSFVSLIKTGSVRGVVVTRAGRPTTADLRRRLDEAAA